MAKLTRIIDVQVAIESTYNTDPGSGYQAILADEFPDSQISMESVQRNTVRGTFSPRGRTVTTKTGGEQFQTEVRPAGLDGSSNLQTAEFDALLRAAGFARQDGAWLVLTSVTGTFEIGETVTNDTAANSVGTVADFQGSTLWIRDLQNMPTASDSVSGDTSTASGTVSGADDANVYRPVTLSIANQESVYAKVHRDGIFYPTGGARASVSGTFTVGEIARFEWLLQGLYTKPTDQSQPSGLTYSDEDPLKNLGVTVALGDVDLSNLAVGGFTFDMANVITPRDDVQQPSGRISYILTDRQPTVSMTVDKDSIANFDPYAAAENQTEWRMAYGLGSAYGSRVRIVAPAVSLEPPQETDTNGVAQYTLNGTPTGNDNELMIIFG